MPETYVTTNTTICTSKANNNRGVIVPFTLREVDIYSVMDVLEFAEEFQ